MRAALFLLVSTVVQASFAPAQTRQAVELRNLGLAQLENERPGDAEGTFRSLLALVPDDPLPHANLAIAALRQQKTDEALAAIEAALHRAPGRGDLLAIEAEVLVWAGRTEEALALFRQAVQAAPQDLEILYALYRHASTTRSDDAPEVLATTLRELARLRPENLVVLLQRGRQAIAAGDRATASQVYLRVRELLWQAPPIAGTLLEQVLGALERDELGEARAPGIRLENLLKSTTTFKASLGELFTNIQGIPVERFVDEPPPTSFGDPVEVRFEASRLDDTPTQGEALAVEDFDGDDRPDLVRVLARAAEEEPPRPPRLEVRRSAGQWRDTDFFPAGALHRLLAVDLNNDGHLDLLGYGPAAEGPGLLFWQGGETGGFEDQTAAYGLASLATTGASAATAFDFDSEGDLDLVFSGPGETQLELFWNSLEGPLQPVGEKSFPQLRPRQVHQLKARDLDRDGDLDLLVAHSRGLNWLDNLRQGRFTNRTAIAGLGTVARARAAVAADFDNDGLPDLVVATTGLEAFQNLGGSFQPWASMSGLPDEGDFSSLVALDVDNDGRLDLAAAGSGGLVVLAQREAQSLVPVPVNGAPAQGISTLLARDLDGDGDLDLAGAGSAGLYRLDNVGGNRNHWMTVNLRGLNKGNDKNNFFGLGATLELRVGDAYQFREASSPSTHFGLGRHRRADLLRIVWSNGVPQNRIRPEVDQVVVEEQVLKGSCPFLYTWNGERIEFVTDLLWGAPLGMPVAPGVWAGADAKELVRVDGARPREGVWDLRITEELWEAAFFDTVRLWVVDHPDETEVASSLRIIPDQVMDDRVLGTRNLRPVKQAWDGTGAEVTARVKRRDEIYADGYPVGDYQGVAARPWSFTFDLGEAPARPLRLVLDGWIFPADASLNLAVAQRRDLPPVLTRLEVETGQGWRTLLEPMGFPAGKTKTMVVDTPPLPQGARRLRIVTQRWLSWDRIAWSTTPADSEPVVRAKLAPKEAVLAYRGFSALVRQAPNAPHTYDYSQVTKESPWLPFAGRYTRYGDVRELLIEADDRSVILAAGDEVKLRFDGSDLAPPPAGWRRTVFLESLGWDKDADRNTYEASRLEPLPFRAMSGYPYAPGEAYPQTPLHQEYRRKWLTREVSAPRPRGPTSRTRQDPPVLE